MASKLKSIFDESSKRVRVILLLVYDALAVIACMFLSLWVRFDFSVSGIDTEYLENAMRFSVINILITVLVFFSLQLYDSLWRYASVQEMIRLVMACVLTDLIQMTAMASMGLHMPRSYYILYLFLHLSLSIIGRFTYRFLRLWRHNRWRSARKAPVATMLIGAGDAGVMLLKEMEGSYFMNYQVVCVIDDSHAKIGTKFRGIPVVGGRDKIIEAADRYGVEEIVIAIPTLPVQDRKEIVNICQETGCRVRILPGIYQIVNNEVSVSNLREVRLEDLLGREPVQVELDVVMDYVKDRVVLVTGGGGSIGSELCRQIAAHQPKQLIIFDIYENTTYDIQMELKRNYPNLNMVVLIGSVRNTHRVETIFAKYHPDLVYHAAAHKHVPLMEDSPNEAIKNNVIGTFNVARMADQYGTKRFVLISTDKAVNPTNIMGASKRLCEKVIQSIDAQSKTEFVAVRFGNVLGSNGSVIPLFKKQIEEGGPVTVTHKDIVRYFMTIPEAVSLVLQAGAYAKGGEIFVLDMGEQVKIDTLARNLIKLSGLKPDEDIKIVYTGLRPGEKLYEEKLMDSEGLKTTANKLIFIGEPIEFDKKQFLEDLWKLKALAYEDLEGSAIRRLVKKMAPTYQYHEDEPEGTAPLDGRPTDKKTADEQDAEMEALIFGGAAAAEADVYGHVLAEAAATVHTEKL